MSGERVSLDRREFLSWSAGALAALGVGPESWARFRAHVASGRDPVRFFTDAERVTVRVLVDDIIPRDARSGSATDAGSLDYVEFVLAESNDRVKAAWHDRLPWFDQECARRFGRPYARSEASERGAVLDTVAWPARAKPELREQAAFFSRVRDLTATAFFSSRMGVQDLGYAGNEVVPVWRGAPAEALRELGVSYAEWDARYAPRP